MQADVVKRPDGKSRGFGTITFKTPEDAQQAIKVPVLAPCKFAGWLVGDMSNGGFRPGWLDALQTEIKMTLPGCLRVHSHGTCRSSMGWTSRGESCPPSWMSLPDRPGSL